MKAGALILVLICTVGAARGQNITVPYIGGTDRQPPESQAYARAPDADRVSATSTAERLAAELGLDRREATRLQVILDEQQLKVDEFLRDQEMMGRKPAVEAVMAVMQKAQHDSMRELRAVLTPEHLRRLLALGGARQLLPASEGFFVRVEPRSAYCDVTGKCIAR